MAALISEPPGFNVDDPDADDGPMANTFVHPDALLVILEVLQQYLEGQQAPSSLISFSTIYRAGLSCK